LTRRPRRPRRPRLQRGLRLPSTPWSAEMTVPCPSVTC
jgi:hypothetical protein